MFTKFSFKNFRTHKETEVELGALTLFIGSNNSGKSNLFAAIRHLSRLAAFGMPKEDGLDFQQDRKSSRQTAGHRDRLPEKTLHPGDFFPHRHRLSSDDEPMILSCAWEHQLGKAEYTIELYGTGILGQRVGCREALTLKARGAEAPERFEDGFDSCLAWPGLQTRLLGANDLSAELRNLGLTFFRDLAECYVYHLQPSFLKARPAALDDENDLARIRIAADLKYTGENLQALLMAVAEKEQRTFDRFLAYMRRFEATFHGVLYDRTSGVLYWEFDFGREPAGLEQFRADVVSDGLLRAAAVALLCAMEYPPSLIMVEEIENGISQKNIGRFLGWLRKAAGKPSSGPRRYQTQFLITSHSPSVLREFAGNLDEAYAVRLQLKGYQSLVTNLNTSLASLVDLGAVDGYTEKTEDGRKIARISPAELVEQWYRGTIGGER